MRQVLCLSIPPADVRQLKKIAKKRGHSSLSSYIKFLVEEDKDLITEAELLQTVRSARKEYQAGKSIKAKSLADLL